MEKLNPTSWNRLPATLPRTTVAAMFHGFIALGLAIGLAFGPTRARPPAATPGPQTGAAHGCIDNDGMRAGQGLVARPRAIGTALGRWYTAESA